MDSFLTGRFPPSNRDSQLQIIRVTSIIQFEKLSSPSLSRIFKYTDVCRSWFFPISRPSLCVSSAPSTFHIPMRSSMRKLGKWGWISYKGEDIENIVCIWLWVLGCYSGFYCHSTLVGCLLRHGSKKMV